MRNATTLRAWGLGSLMAVAAWAPAWASTAGNPPAATATPYNCEGEFWSSKVNGKYSTIGYDYKPSASNKNTAHLGSYSSNINYGYGDSVLYSINFTRVFNSAQLQVRYADAVAGNILEVYFDGVLRGTITTANTGGWGTFVWYPTAFSLGNIGTGTHTVQFKVTRGGGYGMNLDVFKITGI